MQLDVLICQVTAHVPTEAACIRPDQVTREPDVTQEPARGNSEMTSRGDLREKALHKTTSLGGPPSARDREEVRRARLLENAAREARERKQNSRPTTSQLVHDEPTTTYETVDPSTNARTTKSPSTEPTDSVKLPDDLQSTRASEGDDATVKRLEGMSISDILQMKAKAGGPRRRRKIVVSV